MPIGFTFALTENEKINDDFFVRFENIFGFKLTSRVHICESDQGTALLASVEKHGMVHLSCLRHLIVSLKTNTFSEQVSELIKCQCTKDFETLVANYSQSWASLRDENQKAELENILEKVGLGMIGGTVTVVNEHRWKQVSMIERVKYKMPSCTNQIESFHGHLNYYTPRRNEFWHSIKRVIDMIIKKNENFEERFKSNYSAYKRKIKNIIKHRPNDIMISMIKYYETDAEKKTCNCGEASLISAMLEMPIPCSHLHYLKIEFPDILPPKVSLENKFNGELFYEYKLHKSKRIPIDQNYYTKIKKYAVNTIRRFSHNKNQKEISNFINNKLPFNQTPTTFVLGYPIELITAIDDGIVLFSNSKSGDNDQEC